MRHKQAVYGCAVLLVCVLWGLGNPIIKIGAESIAPFASIALRFFLAFALLMACFGRRVIRNLRLAPLLPTLAVCLFTALTFILGSFALMITKATTAGFLMGISVLFTPFLGATIQKSRIHWKIFPIILIVCGGMYLLCGGDGAFSFGAGEVMAILCSLSFAFMLTLSEKYIVDMDGITLAAMQCTVTGVLAAGCALAFEGVYDIKTLTWQGAGAILYLAVFSTCLAYILQNTAIRHISATYASLAYCTEPVFTALFSYILLGEALTTRGLAGASVILICVLYASLPHVKKPHDKEGAAYGPQDTA